MYYSAIYASPVGIYTLASDGDRLVGLWLKGQKHHGAGLPESVRPREGLPLFETVKRWLDRYFSGERPEIAEVPLAPSGSGFRREVWNILCGIPYGRVTTYGEIAKRMGRGRGASQAVGGAVGHNPISVIIPCHRVVGADGSLTGYAGGIPTKMRLLELEGVGMDRLFVPRPLSKGRAVPGLSLCNAHIARRLRAHSLSAVIGTTNTPSGPDAADHRVDEPLDSLGF